MTGTPLIIIALLIILSITIYTYFKNGSEKKLGDNELEDHLKVFIETDEDAPLWSVAGADTVMLKYGVSEFTSDQMPGASMPSSFVINSVFAITH